MLRKKSERGQAIVLIALGIVGLVGLTALAIDGGNAFSNRRHAQNAADTAVLAAALAKVDHQDFFTAGFNRAASNGFNDDGVTNRVTVNNPPLADCNGVNGRYAGLGDYIQVLINTNVDTYFAPVIGVDQVHNCVEAIAHAKPSYVAPMFWGTAVVGLSPDSCNAVWDHGNATTDLYKGGVFSNSSANDPPNCCAFHQNGSGSVVTDGNGIFTVGCANWDSGHVSPLPSTGFTQLPYPPEIVWPQPQCSGPAHYDSTTHSWTKGEVNGSDFSAGDFLNPGLYCITGGMSLHGNGNFTGYDVTLYFKTAGVSVTINLNDTIELSAASTGKYAGLLIYMRLADPPYTTHQTLTINGNATSRLTGTILAPSANIYASGCAASGFNSQIIGYTVEMGGTADTTVIYQDEFNYNATYPPAIELTQ